MIEIIDETKKYLVSESLKQAVGLFLEELEMGKQDLTVVFCDDKMMQQKNLKFRGIDKPTDVLSFPLCEPEDTSMPYVHHLGDIIIDVEMAQRQAAKHGNTLDEEILVLTSHGILHLLGYDHPSSAEWKDFHQAEERILAIAKKELE